MAVDTSLGFSNAVQGIPQVGADFDIYGQHTDPRYAIGTRITRQDGNEYVYCHFGATVNRGVLVSTDVSESSRVDSDNIIVAPASAQTTSDGTIGNKFLEITLASVTVDQYAGGYFVTTDDTGEGYTYRIKGNTATGNPATGNFRMELYEPLQVAVDATTDFAIQGNLYANLEIATAATDNCIAGVTCSTIATAANCGWVQTKGVCGILTFNDDVSPGVGGTLIAIGDMAVLSSDSNGAVSKMHDAAGEMADEEIIGTCLIAGDSTGHGVYKINIS
jgi:hypothetical protein